jgi:DNA recombination protein RmuC
MDPLLLLLVALAGLALGALAVLLVGRRSGRELAALEARLGQLAQGAAAAQAATAETLRRQERGLAEALERRLADFGLKVGEKLLQSHGESQKTLSALGERLAVIDQAQANLTKLSSEVVSLQQLLSNKQARGAFGEAQLEAIVRDLLPAAYVSFQATLRTGSRADCLLALPPPLGPLCIDAKFPREAYDQLRAAAGDNAAKVIARRAFAAAVTTHVDHIAERYVVAGETAEAALMFVPSEAVYAEIHESLPEVVERAWRRRVFIVSPTTLWAVLNTLRAVLKDSRLQEQAHLIQAEVRKLLEDVERLDDRVGRLAQHFTQASEDIRQIRISSDKVTKRGQRIDELELEEQGTLPGQEPGRTAAE